MDTALTTPVVTPIDLQVTGMTCASCAARIEKKLNKVPGVVATVNYATEVAHVEAPAGVSLEDLVAVVESAGYGVLEPEQEVDYDGDDLGRRWRASAVLTVPLLLVSMVPALQFPGWQWLAFLLASVVVLWGGLPFHLAAWTNARHRATTMDTLVSIGVLSAYLWSSVAVLFTSAGELGRTMTVSWLPMHDEASAGSPDLYFESAAVVVTFLLLGRWLEQRAKRRSGAALRALLDLAPATAWLRTTDGDTEVPASHVRVGDLVIARPGERIATDGVVVEGASAVDSSMLTGESVPIDVMPGDEVSGGTVVQDGLLVVRATRVGADTALARITALVAAAQSGKAPVQRLADRVSAVFVPVVLVIALGTLLAWGLTTGWQQGFTAAVAVLVIACPCALGLATPTALLVGTGRGATLGILVRGPEVLESTRRVDTVVLDKTGTLTTGVMTVVHRHGDDEAVGLAGVLESGSTHPIARAVSTYAAGLGPSGELGTHEAVRGDGVTGRVAGHDVRVGRPEWIGLDEPWSTEAALWRQDGLTTIAVSVDGEVRALLAVGDEIRPTTRDAVARLRAVGLEPVMVTGDAEAVARSVAAEVGIDRVLADARPEDKVAEVERLRASGRVVAVVGDGINDAAALAAADLGIAMGGGTDVAIEAADITLLRDDLRTASDAVRLSRATLRTIKQNLGWAFGYNVAAIPLAAAGLLTPMIAGIAMAMSSVCVVGNSLRLRRFS
ncbi:MAG: heavy metal translocating P-type ATPase [Actinomycetales bacterium]|nr:heavy metal translocating P-type ATPase [Actinomycetales bacterium]